MAENQEEGRLIIYVDSQLVRGAGKRAIKGMEKEIQDAQKGKTFKVPVDISVDIDESNPKIKNAQAKVIDSIKKIMAKGFSASNNDIKRIKC